MTTEEMDQILADDPYVTLSDCACSRFSREEKRELADYQNRLYARDIKEKKTA